jgi:Flp pilus assembly protein TadG
MLSPESRRDERGATAVLLAIVITLVLIPMAALGTDLGNAMSRKTATQTQADFAALDAAQLLNKSARAGMTPPAAIIAAVADSMNANQPQHDGNECWRTTPFVCVTAAQLTDADQTNGQIRYTNDGLQVVTPPARVRFGLANAFGQQGIDVSSTATVQVFSPGLGVAPMFAVEGCDYGLQTLTDPASGQVNPIVPPLALDADTNSMNLEVPAVLKDSTGATVGTLAYNSTGNVLELESGKWKDLSKIGFFRGDDTTATLIQNQSTFWTAGDATKTPKATPYTLNSGSILALTIPDVVAATETIWYVRAYDQVTGKWSARAEAVPIRVGQAVLECGAGSNGGNFGTLKLPRTDVVSSGDLPMNLAKGLQNPLNLAVHPEAVADPSLTACTDNTNGAIESVWAHDQLDVDTNCVQTDPGLPAGVATEGLITLTAGGRLTNKPTASGCDPTGGSSYRQITLNHTDYDVNNDVLTCFLKPGKSIADIVKDDDHYTAGVALEEEIFDSPRLVFVPLLRTEPSTGTDSYSIVGFRPGFITDEPATTAAIKNSHLASAENGLRTSTSGQDRIIQIKVVFFNFEALPLEGDIPLQDYFGAGPPITRLID